MSIHTEKARALAQQKGAFAGTDAALPLWKMSKRELVEIAMRLGVLAGDGDESPEGGARRAIEEAKILVSNGII